MSTFPTHSRGIARSPRGPATGCGTASSMTSRAQRAVYQQRCALGGFLGSGARSLSLLARIGVVAVITLVAIAGGCFDTVKNTTHLRAGVRRLSLDVDSGCPPVFQQRAIARWGMLDGSGRTYWCPDVSGWDLLTL